MTDKITFANGYELSNSYVREMGDSLYVYVNDSEQTLRSIFELLNNSENTSSIQCTRYGETTTHTGYTHLKSVSEDSLNYFTATLRKERNE